MSRSVLLVVLLALGACATSRDPDPAPRPRTAHAPPSTADTAAVLATMQQLFDAMAAHDSIALAALVTPPGTFAVVVIEGDSVPRVAHQGLAGFISSVGRPGPPLNERAWDPFVLIDGPFATIWTRYDFRIGDEFSHCGVDVFTLARTGGRWRITGGSYTIQRTGCPASPS